MHAVQATSAFAWETAVWMAGQEPADGAAKHLETLEEPKNIPQFSVTVSDWEIKSCP